MKSETARTEARGSRFDVIGWAGCNAVQRVELYLRQSLYVLLWFLLLFCLPSAFVEAREPWQGTVSVILLLALGGIGHAALLRVVHHYPRQGAPRSRWFPAFGAAALVVLAWVMAVGEPGSVGAEFCLVMAVPWVLGGLRSRRMPWALGAFGAVVLGYAGGHVSVAVLGAVVALFFVFTVQSTLWLLDVVHELDRARRTEASLAVAEERLRFSRDVHDVLGRHLSVIAVQAELAAAMVERGDDRAVDRIRQVRSTAHDALREARELARGYRALDLAQETEGAVALLTSAGVRAEADLAGLPREWHEPVARLVREAVTNVLRHSDATRVRIAYAEVDGGGVVEVRNDRPHPAGSGDGSGLATLARELAPLGAGLTHGTEPGSRADGGEEFVLRLRWPYQVPSHVPSRAQSDEMAGDPR